MTIVGCVGQGRNKTPSFVPGLVYIATTRSQQPFQDATSAFKDPNKTSTKRSLGASTSNSSYYLCKVGFTVLDASLAAKSVVPGRHPEVLAGQRTQHNTRPTLPCHLRPLTLTSRRSRSSPELRGATADPTRHPCPEERRRTLDCCHHKGDAEVQGREERQRVRQPMPCCHRTDHTIVQPIRRHQLSSHPKLFFTRRRDEIADVMTMAPG